MAEYETINSFPVVDQARQVARNYGRSCLEALKPAYEAITSCLDQSLLHCLPSLRRTLHHDSEYDWEDDNDGRWSDELERLLDSEGQPGEDSSNTLSVILSRLPFGRSGTAMPYKPSAANLRRARNKSRTSIHSNGTGGTGESLRSRADLFDHSGDEFEDAGMLPDEHIFALASETGEDSQAQLAAPLTDAELQEENRLAEQREEELVRLKRERAQRLAVKRGLSDNLIPGERPRSSGQGSLRDAIPLRRGRSSTLQSQASDVVPLRGRSSTLGSQSSGIRSPVVEPSRPQSPPPPSAGNDSPVGVATSLDALVEGSAASLPLNDEEETPLTDFQQAENTPGTLTSDSGHSLVSSPQHASTFETETLPPTSEDKQVASSQTASPMEETAPPADNSEQSPVTSQSTAIPPVSPPSPEIPTKPGSQTTVPEKPPIRRTPSKVPGDYDPVTGYYRRKSDADTRASDVD